AEDRAGVVFDRAAGSGAAHEQEAVGAQLLVGTLRLEPVDRLAAAALALDGDLLVLVVVVVLVARDHAILEDPIEVRFDVVGREQLVVVLLLFLALALASTGGGFGLLLLVVVI